MNKIMKHTHIIGLLSLLLFVSCLDDKGNYTYGEKDIITIDMPTTLSVVANAEYIDIKPVITSNKEGAIEDGNANYEFLYERVNSDGDWVILSSENKKDLYRIADLGIGKHTCRYSVTNKRTGIKSVKGFDINIIVSTSEGWMLLCNEGSEERVRLDMLSQLSKDRIIPAYDIAKNPDIPEMYHARSLGFFSNRRGTIGDKITLMAETESYLLNNTYLTIDGNAYEMKASLFASSPEDHIVNFACVPNNDFTNHAAIIAVSKEGNAFVWDLLQSGTAFEDPANTSERGGAPEYRVSPFVGVSTQRSTTGLSDGGAALLYDIDNHRFIGWDGEREEQARRQTCYPLKDPDSTEKLFSFNTGSMELVSMANTAFSNGAVYAIMQDGNKRHIYSINLSNSDFKQEGCWEDIQLTDFDKATLFCAHSQYQTLYYAYKNKVYSYNLSTGASKEAITLNPNEEVTTIKFCMYDNPGGVTQLTAKMDEETAAAFTARQYELIVGSYDTTSTDNNGGILRFYQTSSPRTDLTLKPGWEYTGYEKIIDVKYKEVKP